MYSDISRIVYLYIKPILTAQKEVSYDFSCKN